MRLLILLLPVLAAALVSCSPSKPSAAPIGAATPNPGQIPWNWDNYPATTRMRLASLPCQLQPKSLITMYSPMLGVLKVYISQPQTNLPAGLVWAEFEPTIFKAEGDALEEARVRLEEREKLQLELELPKQKLQLERQIEEAQRQVALLNLLSTNPEIAHLSLNIPGQATDLLKPEALGKARTELSLLSQTLGYLDATNLFVIGIDLPGQRSEWQRRKLDFERRQSQSRLKMPFKGQLTISLPLTEGVEEYPVNVAQELAVARDLSTIRVRVPLANLAWSGLPSEKLSAVIRLPSGEELQAPFAFQKIERVQFREESVFYFQFPPEKSAMAARLIGADVACEVWLNLDEPARIIPKLTLLLQYPSVYQGRNWAQGVPLTWAGAQLLVEGQTDIAVTHPGSAPKTARK